MLEINIDSIIIPQGRFRKDFDEKKLAEIKASILRIGLLHPITVEAGVAHEPEGKEKSWTLRAGERRLRVLKEILAEGGSFRMGDNTYAGNVLPANDYNELTELQRLEIEVEENLTRSDFTWQERTTALAALHHLRKKQNPEQTVAATASEVLGKPAFGEQRMVISNALIIEKHLSDSDVANAKDEREAIKIIKKKTEAAHRAKLAVAFDASKTPHKLILGNAREELEKLSEGTVDVILSDPPYGVGADSFGDMSDTGHNYSDSKENFDDMLKWLPDLLYRVAKREAHCYLFCDVRRFEQLYTLMELAGWKAFPTPFVWDKCGTGMLPFPAHGPRRTTEYILYAWKGDRRTLMVKNDILRIPAVKGLLHGAQKPVAVYSDLLSRSANPGDTILDCFGGSGTILPAANNLKLTAIYIEMNKENYEIALQRVGATGFDDGVVEEDGIEIEL